MEQAYVIHSWPSVQKQVNADIKIFNFVLNFLDAPISTKVCNGSTVDTTLDCGLRGPPWFKSWKGANILWGSINCTGLTELSSYGGSTLGTRAAEHEGCNWGMQVESWLMVAASSCVWPHIQWHHLAYAKDIKSIQFHDYIVIMASYITWVTISYITRVTISYITWVTISYITWVTISYITWVTISYITWVTISYITWVTNRDFLNDWQEDESSTTGELITEQEVKIAIEQMKKGKQQVHQGVTAKMLQSAGEVGIRWVTEICNAMLKKGKVPRGLGTYQIDQNALRM